MLAKVAGRVMGVTYKDSVTKDGRPFKVAHVDLYQPGEKFMIRVKMDPTKVPEVDTDVEIPCYVSAWTSGDSKAYNNVQAVR